MHQYTEQNFVFCTDHSNVIKIHYVNMFEMVYWINSNSPNGDPSHWHRFFWFSFVYMDDNKTIGCLERPTPTVWKCYQYFRIHSAMVFNFLEIVSWNCTEEIESFLLVYFDHTEKQEKVNMKRICWKSVKFILKWKIKLSKLNVHNCLWQRFRFWIRWVTVGDINCDGW